MFLRKRGVPPIFSSVIFGSLFFVPAILFSAHQTVPWSFGYLSCLSWLFIGPFMIYKAGQMVDELWSDMLDILDERHIEELQSYERKFHSYGYLAIGLPAAVIVSILILSSQAFSYDTFFAYILFYLISWVVLALLGSIGVWGTVQLVMLVLAIRKYNLKLNSLSDDRFGGMEFLADFGIKATIMYSTGALMIPMAIEIATRGDLYLQAVSFAIAGAGSFASSVLLSFMIQVFALNRAAVRGKKEILKRTGEQYTALLQEYEKRGSLDFGIRILVMQGLFDEAYQMRVYPWDVGILLKLAGSVALPIVLGTIRLWFPWIPMH